MDAAGSQFFVDMARSENVCELDPFESGSESMRIDGVCTDSSKIESTTAPNPAGATIIGQ